MKKGKSIYDLYFKDITENEINKKHTGNVSIDDIEMLIKSYWEDFCDIIYNTQSKNYPFDIKISKTSSCYDNPKSKFYDGYISQKSMVVGWIEDNLEELINNYQKENIDEKNLRIKKIINKKQR